MRKCAPVYISCNNYNICFLMYTRYPVPNSLALSSRYVHSQRDEDVHEAPEVHGPTKALRTLPAVLLLLLDCVCALLVSFSCLFLSFNPFPHVPGSQLELPMVNLPTVAKWVGVLSLGREACSSALLRFMTTNVAMRSEPCHKWRASCAAAAVL